MPKLGGKLPPRTAKLAVPPGINCISAFSLIELLVVLAIMGILAGLALPRLRTMNQSGGMAAASQQLLDDVGLARRLAIQNRTTVLMVFLPPQDATTMGQYAGLNDDEKNLLLRGQMTTYALFSTRQVGDQPGQANARYLKAWTALPDGFFIPGWKFAPAIGAGFDSSSPIAFAPRFFEARVPVPSLNSVNARDVLIPYIAFGPEGHLQKYDGNTFVPLNAPPDPRSFEVIPIARGGMFLERSVNATGKEIFSWTAPDVAERPAGNSTNNYNLVVIDHLTGRGRLVRPEVQ